ncbi:MAG: hypothetical protein IT480_01360 [Gammaproteobacteria bacterium]|nr:hypothetical protein [Gammaproteobacteria bacterium]
MPTVYVPRRFCGPPDRANGGYACGVLARHATGVVRVRLEKPVPLERDLEIVVHHDGQLELLCAAEPIARATPAGLHLHVPQPPGYLEALEASRHYAGFIEHAYPSCFVCGTGRARGDGLHVFAGRMGTGNLVAAPWTPDPSLDAGDGKVRAEFMWAALDCPGYFAARDDRRPMLLGEFTAQVDRRVHIDEPCVVIGWPISVSGRKYEVGTALFDEDGELCARARGLWLELRRPC